MKYFRLYTFKTLGQKFKVSDTRELPTYDIDHSRVSPPCPFCGDSAPTFLNQIQKYTPAGCPFCKYVWGTLQSPHMQSDMNYITCPRCNKRFRFRDSITKDDFVLHGMETKLLKYLGDRVTRDKGLRVLKNRIFRRNTYCNDRRWEKLLGRMVTHELICFDRNYKGEEIAMLMPDGETRANALLGIYDDTVEETWYDPEYWPDPEPEPDVPFAEPPVLHTHTPETDS